MKKILISFYLIFTLLSGVSALNAQNNYQIFKKQDSIILDGYGHEKTWKNAMVASNFTQNFPTDSNQAISKTEVKMCYDQKYMYVFATCHDLIEEKYVLQSLKRDFSYPRSDAFAIYFDTYNDKANGFSFAVNPMGSQREGSLSNGGSFGVTTSWDAIWYSKVRRTKNAWFVEIKIPFNSIRFPKGEKIWGINFSRNNLKRNENSAWKKVPFGYNIASMAFYGKLLWNKAPQSSLNIAAIPFISARVNNTANRINLNAGLDAKVALSSSLNLDLTFNPDFSQVEADVQQINLTRFNLFFPERRNFFIENQDLFSNAGFRQIRPFFSRKVGLFNGQIQNIIAGAKISGKIGSKNRVGLMNIQTGNIQNNEDSIIKSGENISNIVFQRQVLGASNIGLLLINRQGKNDYNRVGGIDFNYLHKNGKLRGKAFYHHSFDNKRKKKPHTHASWLMYRGRHWFLMWNHEFVSKNYNAELGFVPRQNFYNPIKDEIVKLDYWRIEPEAAYTFYTNKLGLNNIRTGIYSSIYLNESKTPYETVFDNYINFNWKNSTKLRISHFYKKEQFVFAADILRNGILLPDSNYQYHQLKVNFASNYRKPFSYSLGVKYGGFYVGKIYNYTSEVKYRIQPWVQLALNYNYNNIVFPAAFGGQTKLALLGARSDISFTKNIYLTNFFQINTQSKNTSLNTRFQWRFRPLSDLYLVHNFGSNSISNKKTNAFVLKWVWWFNS